MFSVNKKLSYIVFNIIFHADSEYEPPVMDNQQHIWFAGPVIRSNVLQRLEHLRL